VEVGRVTSNQADIPHQARLFRPPQPEEHLKAKLLEKKKHLQQIQVEGSQRENQFSQKKQIENGLQRVRKSIS
jgi:hypothetical protein